MTALWSVLANGWQGDLCSATRICKALSKNASTVLPADHNDLGGAKFRMPDLSHFNDAPILKPSDDRFGINPLAQALARSIGSIGSPVGVTIALNGPWGSCQTPVG